MKTRMPLILLALALFAAAPARCAPTAARLDAAVKAEMARQHSPGAAVAVLQGDKVVFSRAYGVADAETRTPVTTATVFEIGSVTKQFTATAVMMLQEQGKVSIDAPIGKYLTGLPEAWSGIPIRRLLTHTSGIPNYTAQPEFSWNRAYTPDEVLKLVSGKPVDFAPGERWDYSNTNYYLLGILVEKAGGMPLGTFLAQRIFRPLKMTDTRLADEREIILHRAKGFAWEGRIVNAPLLRRGAAGGAGAIVSSIRDMSKWAAAVQTGSLLKPASRREMYRPALLRDGSTARYGLGWALGNRNGHPVIDHGGGTAGFSSMISRYPNDRLSVVVLTNASTGGAGAISDAVAALYVPALARKPLKPAAVDPEPQTTARIRSIVLNLLSDAPDLTPFSAQMQKALTPATLAAVREQMLQAGPLKTFTFVSRKETPAGKAYVYSAVFGKMPIVFHANIAPDGKIAGLWAGPE